MGGCVGRRSGPEAARRRAGRACTNVSRAVASTSTWPTWQPADSRRRSSRLLANMDAGLFCAAARGRASRADAGHRRSACFARAPHPGPALLAGRCGATRGAPPAGRRACSSARSTPQNSVPCSSARNSPTGSAIAPKCSATIVLRAARAARPAAAPTARARALAGACRRARAGVGRGGRPDPVPGRPRRARAAGRRWRSWR
jgi:hypothetical protein